MKQNKKLVILFQDPPVQKPYSKSVGKLVDPSHNPSSSCPQLTIEEPTSTTSSNEEENGKDQVWEHDSDFSKEF